MNKGYFITLEGPDGSGKSTQLELIAEYLRQNGREVVCTREPGGSEAAERLRQLVLDPQLAIDARTETLLYLAARADHLDKVVRPALASGKIVLCDRFSDSTLVYQGFVRRSAAAGAAAAEHFCNGRAGTRFDAAAGRRSSAACRPQVAARCDRPF